MTKVVSEYPGRSKGNSRSYESRNSHHCTGGGHNLTLPTDVPMKKCLQNGQDEKYVGSLQPQSHPIDPCKIREKIKILKPCCFVFDTV